MGRVHFVGRGWTISTRLFHGVSGLENFGIMRSIPWLSSRRLDLRDAVHFIGRVDLEQCVESSLAEKADPFHRLPIYQVVDSVEVWGPLSQTFI